MEHLRGIPRKNMIIGLILMIGAIIAFFTIRLDITKGESEENVEEVEGEKSEDTSDEIDDNETIDPDEDNTATATPEIDFDAIEAPDEVEILADGEPVTIEFFHWLGTELGETVIKEINDQFSEKYPNITVEFETIESGSYEDALKERLDSEDVPDLFGMYPGRKFFPYAEDGKMMPLDYEPWVIDLMAGAQFASSWEGHIMSLPTNANVIGVIYNKTIFSDLDLKIPRTWDAFLEVNKTIKEAGITPMALGLESAWVTQLIPYAMAPSAIYRDNPDFDAQMYAGEVSFVDSPWVQMMEDYLDLHERGYFNQRPLSTDFAESTEMLALGEVAMYVNGSWAITSLREVEDPVNLDWGMFPLPYDNGGDVWVSSAIGGTIAVSAETEHQEVVSHYLDHWASHDTMDYFLSEIGAFPVLFGTAPELDPAAAEMLPYLAFGSYPFLDQNWPPSVQPVMLAGIQAVFDGEMTIEEMLQQMDEAWAEDMEQ